MEPNQNPPSERDWTDQEKDEFYASIGLSGTPINTEPFRPIEWSTSTWNGPIHPLSSDDPFGDLERFIHPGVNITSIVPPESGWPIVAHCDICHKTVIVLSPYAAKPEKGDYFRLNGTCLDENEHIKHNMWPQKWYPWPTKPLPGGYIDATGPHRGVPPTEEDFQQVALMTMYRTMFAQGPIEFQVHDPLPPQDLPSMVEFTQEMPIEEAKKLWPNTSVALEEKL